MLVGWKLDITLSGAPSWADMKSCSQNIWAVPIDSLYSLRNRLVYSQKKKKEQASSLELNKIMREAENLVLLRIQLFSFYVAHYL